MHQVKALYRGNSVSNHYFDYDRTLSGRTCTASLKTVPVLEEQL